MNVSFPFHLNGDLPSNGERVRFPPSGPFVRAGKNSQRSFAPRTSVGGESYAGFRVRKDLSTQKRKPERVSELTGA